MEPVIPVQLDLTQFGYVGMFAIATVACLVGLRRARRITHRDTRRGIQWLLLASAGWGLAMVGYLLGPSDPIRYTSYTLGLVAGLVAVGAWLYFASAYSGRSLHHNATIRWVAVIVFVGLVAIKVTNPVHGLYFEAQAVASPFEHLAIQHGLMHWSAMGLSYALATVGLFILFERFVQVGRHARPLMALVGLTVLPVVFDILGPISGSILEMTYSPLGVAAFAVGVLFVYLERFERIRLAAPHDDPIVVLDADDHIREVNESATTFFPDLRDGLGEPIGSVVPALVDGPDVIERSFAGGTRFYRVTEHPYRAGDVSLGRALILTDVTETERYRRELERQNDRLEQFASMVSHDLRNPLTVAQGYLELLDDASADDEAHDKIDEALTRMEALIDDLLALARQGQPIDDPEPVSLESVASESWASVAASEAVMTVTEDVTLMADPERLQQLLENLFRNAIDHGGADVTVRVGPINDGGFFVEDDGSGIPPDERDAVFESGYSTLEDSTGFGLAIVKEIAEAHRWQISITDGTAGGARFEFSGVDRPSNED